MDFKDKTNFLLISLLVILIYFALIQFYLLIEKTISAANFDLDWHYTYKIIKNKLKIYKIIIVGYMFLFIGLISGVVYLRKKIINSEYYKSFNSFLSYLKDAIFELGGVLGVILFTLLLINVSYGNSIYVVYYFGFRTKDLPHLFEALPYLCSGYLLWSGFNLKRGKIKDYLTLIAFLAWLIFSTFITFIIILFYEADHSHMP